LTGNGAAVVLGQSSVYKAIVGIDALCICL
jgi:hypothetical protein